MVAMRAAHYGMEAAPAHGCAGPRAPVGPCRTVVGPESWFAGGVEEPNPLRESLYTAVGLGILGFQQAQVGRRRLQKELSRLAADIDDRVDPVLDDVEARLSDEVRPLVVQARSALRTVERSLLGPPPRR
jgi:hypothetical protein